MLGIEGIPDASDRPNIAAAIGEFFAQRPNVNIDVPVSRNLRIAGMVVDDASR